MPLPDHVLVRIDLVSGRGQRCDPAPGRILLVGPQHTFQDLADAANRAFGRWDLAPVYVFELADGSIVASQPGPGDVAADTARVMSLLERSHRFGFVFDLADEWRHRCQVLEQQADASANDEGLVLPLEPVPVWGWGTLPDQYGRETPGDAAPGL